MNMAYTPIERNRINPVVQSISRFIMRLLGWGVVGGECPVNKAVISAAPHRSNWDLFYTLLSAASSNVPMWFMMKHNLFFWPLTIAWYYLGGVPINRGASNSVVSQMVKALNRNERMYLVITPEGTRKEVEYWTSGFYYIAREANVPIWPWYINYETKRTGSGPLIYPTDNLEVDFKRIRAFFEENNIAMPSCRPRPRKNKGNANEENNETADKQTHSAD